MLQVKAERARARDDARFRILHLLDQNPEMSQRDLSRAVGISTGSTHYVIRSLVDEGFVKLKNFTNAEDKRRYAYVLTPRGASEKTALALAFLGRKREEFKALKAEISALELELNRASERREGGE